jgi:psp operon transcriptional activator
MERVGSSRTIRVDVRLIAATNANLPKLANEGRFRADLLDRLAFDVITLPPLRARKEDILLLAEHFALNMIRELGREYFPGFSRDAQNALLNYQWPGNVRELKNVVERNVYRAAENELIDEIVFDPFASPFAIQEEKTSPNPNAESDTNGITKSTAAEFPINFKQTITQIEVDLIESALEEAKFNQRRCAQLLGLTYHQLRGYLKKYKILQ